MLLSAHRNHSRPSWPHSDGAHCPGTSGTARAQLFGYSLARFKGELL